MAGFRSIICAIDFDPNSMAALSIARRLAEQSQAKLSVVHVVPPTDPLMISAPVVAQRRYDDARELLAELGRSDNNIQVETVLKTGHIAEEIMAAAHELEADLIVMATHGRTGVPRLVLGSVAERVLREAPCLVMTVNTKAAEHYASRAEAGQKASVA
jgi:nucleotide-binding universal stress UspA family protein